MTALLALPLLYLLWKVGSQRRMVITHRDTFTLGFLWYATVPLMLSLSDIEVDIPSFDAWRSIATMMGQARLRQEVVWSAALWICFLLGCVLAEKATARGSRKGLPPSTTHYADGWAFVLSGVGVASLIFAFAWGAANRAMLFAGYSQEVDDVARGPLQGALLYTSVAAIMSFLRRREIGNVPLALNATAVSAQLLLSLAVGTRGMTVLAFVMALVLASRLRNGLSRAWLLVSAGMSIIVLSSVAALRLGVREISYALATPILEPLFTYFSISTYLTFNDVPLIAAPTALLTSFVNLVPRALWPEKIDIINSLYSNVVMFAPLGGAHLFFSLLVNFGWLGSLAVALIAGFAIEHVSYSTRPAYVASYTLIVAVLMTDLWRNPFSQSVVKSLFQGALVVPALLTLGAITVSVGRRELGEWLAARRMGAGLRDAPRT